MYSNSKTHLIPTLPNNILTTSPFWPNFPFRFITVLPYLLPVWVWQSLFPLALIFLCMYSNGKTHLVPTLPNNSLTTCPFWPNLPFIFMPVLPYLLPVRVWQSQFPCCSVSPFPLVYVWQGWNSPNSCATKQQIIDWHAGPTNPYHALDWCCQSLCLCCLFLEWTSS